MCLRERNGLRERRNSKWDEKESKQTVSEEREREKVLWEKEGIGMSRQRDRVGYRYM